MVCDVSGSEVDVSPPVKMLTIEIATRITRIASRAMIVQKVLLLAIAFLSSGLLPEITGVVFSSIVLILQCV